MQDREEHLARAMERLLGIRNECTGSIASEHGLPDMTVKQVSYLRIIDELGDVTFTRLAEVTRTSKPTVTEMVNRWVRKECVYRERCPDDGRIQYIRLTEKGRAIAQADRTALRRTIERMMNSLDERETELLIEILTKVR